jgi:hypothetical protein
MPQASLPHQQHIGAIMKNLSLLLASAFISTGALAKTTIEFPLKGDVKINGKFNNNILLSSLNKKLSKAGLPGFPDVAVFGKNDVPYAKKLRKMTDNAEKALGVEFNNVSPIGYSYFHNVEMCYRGDINEVKQVIDALYGPVFLEDQGLQAIRYGSKKYVYEMYKDDFFENNAEVLESDLENNPAEVKAWKAHKSTSKNVLLLTDLGPQGDGVELNLSVIKPCK